MLITVLKIRKQVLSGTERRGEYVMIGEGKPRICMYGNEMTMDDIVGIGSQQQTRKSG